MGTNHGHSCLSAPLLTVGTEILSILEHGVPEVQVYALPLVALLCFSANEPDVGQDLPYSLLSGGVSVGMIRPRAHSDPGTSSLPPATEFAGGLAQTRSLRPKHLAPGGPTQQGRRVLDTG